MLFVYLVHCFIYVKKDVFCVCCILLVITLNELERMCYVYVVFSWLLC